MKNIVLKTMGMLKRFFGIGAVLYTCLSFAIIWFYRSTVDTYGITKWIWTDIEKLFADILVFAVIAAAVVVVVDIIPKLPSVLRCLIKLVLIYGDFYLWMLIGNKNAGHIMIMSTIYIVVFFAVVGINALIGLVRGICEKSGVEEYDSVFDPSDEKAKAAAEKKAEKKGGKK